MAHYTARIAWDRTGAAFSDGRYSRAHRWTFDGGAAVPASASPHHVPPPLSDPAGVDPEEAFVAALASCHMLWFLAIAAKRGFVIDRYADEAAGTMGQDPAGRLAITRVVLRPRVRFLGGAPEGAAYRSMHDEAHERCFIANSVKTEVLCEPAVER